MAKKTSTTTRKGSATRSSGGASTTKGNSSRNSGRAATKGGQSYDDNSYSSESTKGGSMRSDDYDESYSSAGSNRSNIKPGGNAGRYSSGSSTKEGASYNDNYNSGDSYNSGNTKESNGYSDSYNDSGSSAKEDSSYNDNSGDYSNDGYESGISTKGDNAYNANYSSDDSYNSGNGKDTGGYSNNEPINDPPPYEDYNDEVVAKTPNTGGSSNTSKYGNNEGEADMTFTEEEAYGDDTGTREDSEERERSVGPLASITPSQIRRVKQRLNIPENGFVVSARGGRTVRKNVEVERMNQLLERLENREIAQHVQDTINLFVDETDRRSHQDRNQIDIALILAIAIRESGVALTISRRNNRIVSAGRDAHSLGRSGLDWIYDKRRSFPSAIRNQVRPVRDNSDVGGEFKRPNVTPAFLRERDLLAAFVVEVNVRNDRFLRFFNERVFNSDFNDEQRAVLLQNLNHDAKKAWIQAAFGSKLMQLLQAVRDLIQGGMESGTSFGDIAADDMINLNAIVTNDGIMTDSLSRQRTRISAAEAILMEEALGNRF